MTKQQLLKKMHSLLLKAAASGVEPIDAIAILEACKLDIHSSVREGWAKRQGGKPNSLKLFLN